MSEAITKCTGLWIVGCAGGILIARLLWKSASSHGTGNNCPNTVTEVLVPDMPRLPEFCHATIHEGLMHISGCIGLKGNEMSIVEGGIKNEIIAALDCVKRIIEHAEVKHSTELKGGSVKLLKINVYLKDNTKERFFEMNEGYAEFFRQHRLSFPARITVGCGALALGAQVEIDAVATF